ncbi:MAG: FAD-dependent oxidoreductase [Hyphomicrobiales bacterium]|nr:FAD-dependent oxidoreductase [Hyphomicrobiales bacterium]
MANDKVSDSGEIVIIGASHAGVQLAASLREAMFEGSVTLLSDDQQVPYHRPPLSKAFLKDPNVEVQVLRAEDYYDENNIKLIKPVCVIKIDPDNSVIELNNGVKLPYSKLVIATGARPRLLNMAGINANGVYQLRNYDDAQLLRKASRIYEKVVVVGGGFIGLEVAATLKHLGMDVSVVEAAPRLMGRVVAPEISQFVLEKFEKMGISVSLDMPISQIEVKNGNVSGVICGEKHFASDMVLIGAGVVPNDELAKDAGLETGNGIHVDVNFQTSAENIYAIGDVSAYEHWLTGTRIRLESVQNATDQARNLASFLTGKPETYRAVPWFWSDQADMKIQMVGLSHNSKSVITRENRQRGSFSAFHYEENNRLIAIDTINAPADHMAGRKLLGEGISPTPEQAADADFRLKNLLN